MVQKEPRQGARVPGKILETKSGRAEAGTGNRTGKGIIKTGVLAFRSIAPGVSPYSVIGDGPGPESKNTGPPGARQTNTARNAQKGQRMTKEFNQVLARVEEIKKTVPKERAEYVSIIEAAQADQAKAEQAKEVAQTEKAFNQACDDLTHAREREAHFKKLLDAIDGKQRMSESEYFEFIERIRERVTAEADNFRRVAEKAIDDIAQARAEYEAITADADKVLSALDVASNVLQNKYKYRECTYIGKPSVSVLDPNNWKSYAIRYSNAGGYPGGRGNDLVIYDDPEKKTGRNEKILAAWNAAGRVLNN